MLIKNGKVAGNQTIQCSPRIIVLGENCQYKNNHGFEKKLKMCWFFITQELNDEKVSLSTG